MPTAPVIPSSGSSLMQLIVLTLLLGGVGFALAAIPAVRGRFSQHASQVDQFLRPARQTAPVTKEAEPVVNTTARREIDEFDLDIFGPGTSS